MVSLLTRLPTQWVRVTFLQLQYSVTPNTVWESEFSSLLCIVVAMRLSGQTSVQQGLQAAGFTEPSPVQLAVVPLGRFGLDLIVQVCTLRFLKQTNFGFS